MAIKGKKKPKARSGRAVTAGPRPAYVAPKVPPLQRTGAKFALVLAIEAIIFSLLIGFAEQSEGDLEKARIGEFTTLVQTALETTAGLVQTPATGPQVLPDLPVRMSEVEAGGADAETITVEAEGWAETLDAAATRVLEVSVDYKDLEIEQRLDLAIARDNIDRGLRIYVGLAEQLVVAVQIEGETQRALLDSMVKQVAVGTTAFQSGYALLQDVRRQVGLPPTTISSAGAVPGFPGGTAPPFPELEGTVPAEPLPEEDTGGGGGQNGGGGGGNG